MFKIHFYFISSSLFVVDKGFAVQGSVMTYWGVRLLPDKAVILWLFCLISVGIESQQLSQDFQGRVKYLKSGFNSSISSSKSQLKSIESVGIG